MTVHPALPRHLTLLVAGHRPNRLPQADAQQTILRERLALTLQVLQKAASTQDADLKVVTGTAGGSDAWTVAETRQRGIDCCIVGPHALPVTPSDPAQTVSRAWLADGGRESVPEAWFAATDEARLSMADLVVVVWDGGEPRGTSGGTVRLLIEALRRAQPVVWLDASTTGTGRVLLSRPLPTAQIALLDADENHIAQLHDCFTPVLDSQTMAEDASRQLNERFATLLQQLTRSDAAQAFEQLLQEWAPPAGPRAFAGAIFSHALRPFGYKPRPRDWHLQPPWRGPQPFVDGSGLGAETWACFDAADRAANHAAYAHRDLTVGLHLLAALAVICAVAGAVSLFGGTWIWAVAEFASLVCIYRLVRSERRRKVPVHRAWLLLRQAAEAFRVQALLRPFLASLPALERSHWRESRPASANEGSGQGGESVKLISPQTWWASRCLREAGPPVGPDGNDYVLQSEFKTVAATLRSLIENQASYHHESHERWEKLHHGLEKTMKGIFWIVGLVVASHLLVFALHFLEHAGYAHDVLAGFAHWLHDQHWLLLITAAGPAFAACLHGIGSKLEIKRIAEQSEVMTLRLKNFLHALGELESHAGPDRFMALRTLAIQVASAMYAEHAVWVTLLNGNEVELPA